MGNTHGLPWNRPLKDTDASAMFHALDVQGGDRLTLKDLLSASDVGITLPHSLPALYFFDKEKDGTLTLPEFVDLVHFCHSERRKVEDALSTDKPLRDLILRASRAGVKDCSVDGRSSFRRFSSYSNVRSVFSSRETSLHGGSVFSALSAPPALPGAGSGAAALGSEATAPGPESAAPGSGAMPPRYPSRGAVPEEEEPIISRSSTESSEDVVSVMHTSPPGESASCRNVEQGVGPHVNANLAGTESPVTSDVEEVKPDGNAVPQSGLRQTVAMYCSQREFDPASNPIVDEDPVSSRDFKDPQNRTALDAAVLENIMHANIHKLADLLHTEGAREEFMAWLWNLADINSSGVVTLEELRVFLAALSEDGIDLEELVFYKEVGVPLEECIMNEFDTTHAGLLNRDEFMVLADLVTREYEFWENRHLERIGDYELGRTIGRGSSGVVRLAMHVETRKKVAIKIIKKGKCSDLSRLDREIQSLMAAKHKHIVALEEVMDSEANLFIVMELCGGGTLVDIVRLYPEERMPEETARFFMRQVFEALAFCHRNGICHRDVRLDNLMLDNAGNVKITDFGHSGIYTPGWDLFSTSLVGSVYNLSPEQILGQLYSGEKIDVWSAGVAVYCLLVGQPPFFEPEVTPLLERITACEFEVPDFLSQKAKDLIHCMIRAVPEERITIQQMLHHPWFYDGPEYGPSMDVVVIPVDSFFKKRPDIAEMIMAITIYQHNLHFHLADTQNPKSSPEDQRGQEWTLKCLCPKNDIKFKVSLFTSEPSSQRSPKKKGGLQAVASYSALPELSEIADIHEPHTRRGGSASRAQRESIERLPPVPGATSSGRSSSQGSDTRAPSKVKRTQPFGAISFSASKPPLQRRHVKITPLTVAAHIRAKGLDGSVDSDMFDFYSERSSNEFSVASSHEESVVPPQRNDTVTPPQSNEARNQSTAKNKERKGRHSRSHSLDDTGSIMRINRSATVDAFPYQKVYPQREMPDSARLLNFDKPDASSEFREPGSVGEGSFSGQTLDGSSFQLNRFHRSVTLNAVSSLRGGDLHGRTPAAVSPKESEITQKLTRHPSKAVSPQSPQVRLSPQESVLESVEDLTLTATSLTASQTLRQVAERLRDNANATGATPGSSSEAPEPEDFQPYIEVRLQDGESGVFLKICRKLKNICTTKLAAAAERQKKKMVERRSWAALRRSASARSIDSQRTSDLADAVPRAPTGEGRAASARA